MSFSVAEISLVETSGTNCTSLVCLGVRSGGLFHSTKGREKPYLHDPRCSSLYIRLVSRANTTPPSRHVAPLARRRIAQPHGRPLLGTSHARPSCSASQGAAGLFCLQEVLPRTAAQVAASLGRPCSRAHHAAPRLAIVYNRGRLRLRPWARSCCHASARSRCGSMASATPELGMLIGHFSLRTRPTWIPRARSRRGAWASGSAHRPRSHSSTSTRHRWRHPASGLPGERPHANSAPASALGPPPTALVLAPREVAERVVDASPGLAAAQVADRRRVLAAHHPRPVGDTNAFTWGATNQSPRCAVDLGPTSAQASARTPAPTSPISVYTCTCSEPDAEHEPRCAACCPRSSSDMAPPTYTPPSRRTRTSSRGRTSPSSPTASPSPSVGLP